jgi:radical SAM protein with 4Fe4S-binding SPASM domain
MRLDDFRRILDNVGAQVNQIILYFMGESCLNKQIYDMIAEAKKRKIYVSMCTNGDVADGKRLVESGVDEISFQIGGTTQQTHAVYRIGSHLDAILEEVNNAAKERDRLRTDTRVVVGLIVMKHNEHEVADFARICESRHVIPEIINPCVRTAEQAKEFMPDATKYWVYDWVAMQQDNVLRLDNKPPAHCWWIYYSTVICWNGDVVPCCRDPQGEWVMGNVLREDFSDIWNSKKYQEFRGMVAIQRNRPEICQLCSGFGVPRLK